MQFNREGEASMPSTENERVVYEFQKNSREVVKAVRKTWNGRDLADLRVYFVTEAGIAKPGPKGLCLQVEHLPELKAAVDALVADSAEVAS